MNRLAKLYTDMLDVKSPPILIKESKTLRAIHCQTGIHVQCGRQGPMYEPYIKGVFSLRNCVSAHKEYDTVSGIFQFHP